MPTPAVGLKSFIGFVTESVYGTDPGSGYKYNRLVSQSILPTAEMTRGNRGLGRLGPSSLRNRVKRNEGDIVIDPQYEGIEVLYLHFFGGVDTVLAGTPVGGNTHTMILSPNRKVGLTLHLNQDITKAVVTGGKLTSLEWNLTNENLEAKFGVVGRVHSEATLDTPTYPTAPDILALDNTPGTYGLFASLDASPLNISSARITCDFPYQTGREYLGYDIMQEPLPNDICRIKGELSREFEDTTFSTKWIANTVGALVFEYKSSTIISGTARYNHKITLSEVTFGSARAPIENGGVMVEKIPFEASVKVSDASYIYLTEINSITTAVT